MTSPSTATAGQSPETQAPPLLRSDHGGVATLTLNRPSHYNALSDELLAALQQNLDAIEHDSSVRVVVVAAEGPAFCAGHDLKQIRANPRKDYYNESFRSFVDGLPESDYQIRFRAEDRQPPEFPSETQQE